MKYVFNILKLFAGDRGTATIEFVLMFPACMMFFLIGMERSLTHITKTKLNYAVETTIKDVKSGKMSNITASAIISEICSKMASPTGCSTAMTVEMNILDTTIVPKSLATEMKVPDYTNLCGNTSTNSQTTSKMANLAAYDFVLVRVCFVTKVVMPTSISDINFASALPGEHELISTTAFVYSP